MKNSPTIWALLAAGTLLFAGCEDSAKQHVKARPPAKTPVPASARAQAPEFVREKLPFPDEAPAFVYLNGDARPRIDVVLEKVQAKFDAGQKEYKAGNLQAARVDFDRAVDLILTSGFQVDFDPRLSELFDQIGEMLHTYEQTAQAGNEAEEEENPGTPAPMDELAELTL